MNISNHIHLLKNDVLQAWKQYRTCQTSMVWPMSFLLLAPLALFIVFGIIFPLELTNLGWIELHNYVFISILSILLAPCLLYITSYFLYGCYAITANHLGNNPVDENSGFPAFKAPLITVPSRLIVLIILTISININSLLTVFLPHFPAKLIVAAILLMYSVWAALIMILGVTQSGSPWLLWLKALKLINKNRNTALKVSGVIALVYFSTFLPLLLIKKLSGLFPGLPMPVVAIFYAVTLIPVLYNLIRLIPFTFYYPFHVYKQDVIIQPATHA
ncbi:hypothetical protein [Legionella spiritensis]|uniref:Transmembrane protein n=1 Tax=Legionella spiritensis TaxID=452 RepID=A0A0W0YWW7_LEGSP|nr:hypothetical protein [Legionella spiritensis]KTD61392.1 hypothetical protein Lspi_2634 [Legionella spiritensis]SNV33577.1 Uncharacterised protein [Legionella spiritensis]